MMIPWNKRNKYDLTMWQMDLLAILQVKIYMENIYVLK